MATAPLKLYTYLNFGGNCEEAFRFYEKNLGGKFVFKMTFGEMPDKKNIPPGQEKAICMRDSTWAGPKCWAPIFQAINRCAAPI